MTHSGIDIVVSLSMPIFVVTATWHNFCSCAVKIKQDDIYSNLYALYMSVGQTYKEGQIISDCGSTIYSRAYFHFEVIQNQSRYA